MKINLRSTILRSPQGQEIIIPNKEVLQSALINYSHSGMRRIDLNCGVAYGDDLDQVKEIAIKAIEEANLNIPAHRPVEFFYTEFGGSSVDFIIRFWQNQTAQGEYLEAKSNAIIALKKAFDSNGITIPFPITTLDFGVVGGMGINEIYPPKKVFSYPNNSRKNGQKNGKIPQSSAS